MAPTQSFDDTNNSLIIQKHCCKNTSMPERGSISVVPTDIPSSFKKLKIKVAKSYIFAAN